MKVWKRFIQLMLMFIFLILVFIQCQEVPRKPGAEMVFDKKSHDFGRIEQGKVVSHVFNFENIGADTLEIAKVLSSWGCAASLLSSEVIAPGESGELKVTFKSKKRKGKNKKTIRIYSNDRVAKMKKLTITANVILPKES